jgi:hypothetical protein
MCAIVLHRFRLASRWCVPRSHHSANVAAITGLDILSDNSDQEAQVHHWCLFVVIQVRICLKYALSCNNPNTAVHPAIRFEFNINLPGWPSWCRAASWSFVIQLPLTRGVFNRHIESIPFPSHFWSRLRKSQMKEYCLVLTLEGLD